MYEGGHMLLSVDAVMKAAGVQNGNQAAYVNDQEDTDNIAALKFTERIEREVLIVAGISDSGNHTINIVRSKYQGQNLSEGYFHNGDRLDDEDTADYSNKND